MSIIVLASQDHQCLGYATEPWVVYSVSDLFHLLTHRRDSSVGWYILDFLKVEKQLLSIGVS